MDLLAFGVPSWFSGSSIIIELIFAIVALLVAFYAYKVYRIARQRYTMLFGMAFLSISFAYFIQAILNFLIMKQINSFEVFSTILSPNHCPAFPLSILAVGLHIFFMIVGISLLAYVTMKERGQRIYVLLLLLSLIGILFSGYLILTYYLLTSAFLLFITLQHFKHHKRHGSTNTLLVFFGFGLVFLGTLQLAIATVLGLFYIIGHLTVLVGYLFLLASLLRVVR